jgi:serine protease Do
MITSGRKYVCVSVAFGIFTFGIVVNSTIAQQRAPFAKTEAPLVVEGTVKEVFKSPRQGRTDYLIQIEADRSEGRKALPAGSRLRFPGPGETVYIHVSQALDQSGRVSSGNSHKGVPEERTKIKAFLTPREQGGWEGTFPDWMETTDEKPAEPKSDESIPDIFGDSTARSSKSTLGMTTEVIKVQKQLGLRVTSVERGGPAQNAGLEVGDIIAGIEKAPISGADQLDTLAAKGKKFSLIVVDVNTGRGTQIEIDPKAGVIASGDHDAAGDENIPTKPAAPEQAPAAKVSLGISAEPVTLGSRSVLKVTRVDPNGLGAKAGLEVNDIIVAANGIPTTGPEQLLGALRKSGPKMTLTVRDSRTGRDTPVEVNLGGSKPEAPVTPAETDAPLGTPSGKLGAVTELAFHDDDFAVKITEIEPGSAAARAGLKPGILIISANGKPVLHPNDLNNAARESRGPMKLTVVDPNSGKKANVEVNLGK